MARAGDCDFRRWHFPDDPDLDVPKSQGGFLGVPFKGVANFNGATFSGVAWFDGATFIREARFRGATFSGNAWFSGVTFGGWAGFIGATFSGSALFFGATFSVEAWFDGATFSGDAGFAGATFSGDTRFSAATFSGTAGFKEATFGKNACFDRTGFNADALFDGACFEADAGFHSSRFGPGSNILFNTSRPRPFPHPRHGESAYRFAKQAARARGDYQEEGRYHYAEHCAIEARQWHTSGGRPWRLSFWGWAAWLVLGRMTFGYGEHPGRLVFLILAVVLVWTGLYLHLEAVGPGGDRDAAEVGCYEPTFWESLHFSVVTFTTLGYGDFVPKPAYRLLADAEAALGAGLLATFVVCLTRKYMR